MDNQKNGFDSIEEYILQFPANVQAILQELRKTIKESAPEAEEKISYQMPTFYLYGNNLVHFAAYKKHIGFYPSPSGIEAFKEEISKYTWSKGAVQFPINSPIPLELVAKIVRFRVEENLRRQKEKRRK